MKQSKKGNQYFFGMKAHTGIDAVTELTYSIAANVADVTMAGHLVRDKDNRVYGDAGYTGIQKYLGETKDTQDYRCCVTATCSVIKAQLFTLFVLSNLVLASRCQDHADRANMSRIWPGSGITRLPGKIADLNKRSR